MIDHYGLTAKSAILDVGCGKGFLVHDFREALPGATVAGLDISQYAIDNAMPDVKPYLRVGNAKELPYPDKSFDLVVSINTIHNLKEKECFQSLQEMERVSRRHKFLVVDAYRNPQERENFEKWNLTAETYFDTQTWQEFFAKAGYTGDFYWFIA
jgi:ubiquinone/menaquinone biosynthesis C-methylase UbiE